VRALLAACDDALVRVRPLLEIVPQFGDLLDMSSSEQAELAGLETLTADVVLSALPLSWPAPLCQ